MRRTVLSLNPAQTTRNIFPLLGMNMEKKATSPERISTDLNITCMMVLALVYLSVSSRLPNTANIRKEKLREL